MNESHDSLGGIELTLSWQKWSDLEARGVTIEEDTTQEIRQQKRKQIIIIGCFLFVKTTVRTKASRNGELASRTVGRT